MTCYQVIKAQNAQQEWYETASGDARRRKAQLRREGFDCHVSPMGPQVTPVGIVKMTLVHIPTGPGTPSTPEMTALA